MGSWGSPFIPEGGAISHFARPECWSGFQQSTLLHSGSALIPPGAQAACVAVTPQLALGATSLSATASSLLRSSPTTLLLSCSTSKLLRSLYRGLLLSSVRPSLFSSVPISASRLLFWSSRPLHRPDSTLHQGHTAARRVSCLAVAENTIPGLGKALISGGRHHITLNLSIFCPKDRGT